MHFYIRLIGIPTVKEIEIVYIDSTSVGLEDGSRKIVPLYDRRKYSYAFGNATFNKKFPKVSNEQIDYIEFDILIDTILNINRLGRYNIPDRKGYTVNIKGDLGNENYFLINLRRNYYKVLDNLILNLEPGDEYYLLCQRNNGTNSKFFCTRFVLKGDLIVEPEFTKYTYSQLRNLITINPQN